MGWALGDVALWPLMPHGPGPLPIPVEWHFFAFAVGGGLGGLAGGIVQLCLLGQWAAVGGFARCCLTNACMLAPAVALGWVGLRYYGWAGWLIAVLLGLQL